MNKKNNRKGFTIVELVIVIAVIGILATVLVPTFSDVVSNATKAAVKQDAKAIYNSYVADAAETGTFEEDCWVKVEKNSKTYYVEVVDGAMTSDPVESVTATGAYWLLAKDAVPVCTNCTKDTADCTNCGAKKTTT